MKKTKKEIAPVEVVEVKTKSEAKDALKRGYAIQKAANPELYALKNKDAELERKLKAL